MLTVSEVKQLGTGLIQKEKDLKNIEMMKAVYNITHGIWDFEGAPDWFRAQPSSDGFDAVKDPVDFTSYLFPNLKITPYSGDAKDKRNADLLEQALTWQLKRTMNRRGDVHREILWDAFAYGRVAAQLVYLPYYADGPMKVFKGSQKRQKMALRYGEFALIHKDPMTVFPYFTDYMLEGVLSVDVRPAKEVVDFWGDEIAKPLKKEIAKNEKLKWVTTYDYWDIDQRCVFVSLSETSSVDPESVDGIELFNEENEIDFLPWIVQDLGDELKPMLYPLYKFDYWHTQNLVESILFSEAIYYAVAPRKRVTGQGTLERDYGEPGGEERVRDMMTKVEDIPPPQIDRSLIEIANMQRAKLSKSTVPHNVQTGDFGSGTPYSGMREVIELAARRERDGRSIVEKYYEEVYKQMLYWKDFTGDKMTSYGERDKGGQIVVSPPDEDLADDRLTFNPERLFFEVTLMPKKPENDVQAMNAANMFYQLGAPKRDALEVAGVSNPTEMIEERRKEDIAEANHQAAIQGIMFRSQFNNQRWAEKQAQKEAAKMQQQGGGQGGVMPGGAPGGMPGGMPGGGQLPMQSRVRGRGNENLRGPGFDPAMGGMPPEMGNPGTSSPPVQGEANLVGGV
ncbi:hypothetical protein KQH61_06010 [bacterium]|nr:hypothetical protein [bacterium]